MASRTKAIDTFNKGRPSWPDLHDPIGWTHADPKPGYTHPETDIKKDAEGFTVYLKTTGEPILTFQFEITAKFFSEKFNKAQQMGKTDEASRIYKEYLKRAIPKTIAFIRSICTRFS